MKLRIFLFLLPVLFLSLTFSLSAKDPLLKINKVWKFMPGDNPGYAKSDFDDSNWKTISVDKTWESQGYPDLEGYAWYRTKIIIPSSLKHSSKLKDSIIIYLGKIDDYDQSFLNGKIIGINCRRVDALETADTNFKNERPVPWNRERYYKLAVSDPRILWDKENSIAVRVFDHGGEGGMFSGIPSVGTATIKDYFLIDYSRNHFDLSGGNVAKTIYLNNISSVYKIFGELTITGKDKNNRKIYYSEKKQVTLQPKDSKEFSYSFKNNNQFDVTYSFNFSERQGNVTVVDYVPYILTPAVPKEPKINGAKVYGQRPGKPFLYSIAATGERPMVFNALDLPKELKIEQKTGIISGKVNEPGDYKVTLIARNLIGEAKSILKISIGDRISLTPPMGWNSWNAWGLAVDQKKVIASAKVYKEKGLMNHGWTYINIDDGWEIQGSLPDPKRDVNGNILCNSKFPDMKALGDSIHSLGLKFGIYSSPGLLTCGEYTASYGYELNDAKSYASWGIDYLKYDWCSYDKIAKDHSLPELQKPYFVMRDALQKIDRDIVYSLCQYGMGNVWEWGDKVGGQLWRTTGDITDTWKSMSDIGFDQVKNAPFAKPGNWNDPDMLVVGWVGWGPNLHPTRLTPDEQYTHISLWCLLSAPLLIGCDLTRLDDFTLNLLTNDEVLALDQDPLGRQAVPKIKKDNIQVWVKELEDGNKAVGIFNLADKSKKFSLDFSELGIKEKVKVRDIWRQKDLGDKQTKLETVIPPHGVTLVKLFSK